MKMLRSTELPSLLLAQPGPCLSMYMPVNAQSPRSIREKWDAAIDRVSSLITEHSTQHRARFLLEPLRALPEGLANPKSGTKGVALFRSFTTAGYYPIAEKTPQLTAVSDTFHLKPLLKLIQRQERYFALSLSQKRISLYRGNRGGLRLIGTYEADYGDPVKKARPGRASNTIVVSHGKSGRDSVVHFRPLRRVSRFLELVEPFVWKALRNETAPLVLVGTPFMHRLYRNMNCYPHLCEKGVIASLPHKSHLIHERAWPIAEGEFSEREQALVEQFYGANHEGRAGTDLDGIAKASLEGRIEKLLVAREARLFGLLDRARGRVVPLDATTESFGDDVLDDIAQEVIVRKGSVYVLEAQAMPEGSPVAATFRW